MTGSPSPHLIIDFDKMGLQLPQDASRCDYLFVAEGEDSRYWVIVLELKKGRLHAGRVVKQLRAGADFAKKLIPKDQTLRFRAIAAVGKVSKYERLALKKINNSKTIKLHGQMVYVELMPCGSPLIDALHP